MDYVVLNRADLPHDGSTYEFEGVSHQDTPLSFIWVDLPPGSGIRLHWHPYAEIFIIQEGVATFTVGGSTLEARAGQVVMVQAGTTHAFRNAAQSPLRQIDIHVSKEFVTHWLED